MAIEEIPELHRAAYFVRAVQEMAEAAGLSCVLINHPDHGNVEQTRGRIMAHLKNAMLFAEGKREI